jgi:hypothetical protein
MGSSEEQIALPIQVYQAAIRRPWLSWAGLGKSASQGRRSFLLVDDDKIAGQTILRQMNRRN